MRTIGLLLVFLVEIVRGIREHEEWERRVPAGIQEAVDKLGTGKLIRYSILGAEHALNHFAPEEALKIIDKALEIMTAQSGRSANDDSMTAALYHVRGRALDAIGDPVASESLIKAFRLYDELGDKAHAIEAALTSVQSRASIGSFKIWLWNGLGLPSLQKRALAVATPGSSEAGWLLCQEVTAANLQKALAIAKATGDEKLETWVLGRWDDG